MPLIDDLKYHPTDDELKRRKFLGLAGSGALATIALGAGITTVKFLEPNVLFEESSRFKVGRPEEIPPGTMLVLEREKVYILHGPEGFVAYSSVCTHLGCMTRYEKATERIFCPCHGSVFSPEDGEVTGGPAPKPLTRLRMSLEKGELYVDAAAPAGPDETLVV